MYWFHIPHALFVILTLCQISVGQSNEEPVDITTLDPVTTDQVYDLPTPESNEEGADQMARRFKKPPVSAYQPMKYKKKPNNVLQEILAPPPPPPPPPHYIPRPPPPPHYIPRPPPPPHYIPRTRPHPGPMPRPMPPRIQRPRPTPSPPFSLDFLPSALSGLSNVLNGGSGLLSLLGPLSNLIKPGSSILSLIANCLGNLIPFGNTIINIFRRIRNAIRFISDCLRNFSLTNILARVFHFIPHTIQRIVNAILGGFGFIRRIFDRICNGIKNLFLLIPKSLMLIPRFFHWLSKLPERIDKAISFFYRLISSIEMLLAFIKQMLWNILRLVGNTILTPLRVISKSITALIYLPIKLFSEPILAFEELLRAFFNPFRKLCRFVVSRIKRLFDMIFNIPPRSYRDPSQPPLIRVFPKVPSSPLIRYVLGNR